uniref:Uncharacterized protein LOC114328342 isoform X2 n=1 Tax=Diabrotica virgifera virgifera TaxID=50390 RepID=A0A6P7FBJ6_DIAVI
MSFVTCTSIFHYILYTYTFESLLNMLQFYVVFVTEMWVILILIINSCDRVEKKANELLEACIYVAGETKDATAQDMVNFIKYLIPKFSCAGFFGINQMVLSTFLSTTSTYIIIILQFRAINPPT